MGVLYRVFTEVSYIVITSIFFAIMFILQVLLLDSYALYGIWSLNIALGTKLYFTSYLFRDLLYTQSTYVLLYPLLFSFLFSVNIALLFFYMRARSNVTGSLTGRSGSGVGISMWAFLASLLGSGCASCGVFLLSSLFTVLGLGIINVYLPVSGTGLRLLSIALLLYSIYLVIEKIRKPNVCSI